MNSTRIHQIQQETAYVESSSVSAALHQVWNEVQQEANADLARVSAERDERMEEVERLSARLVEYKTDAQKYLRRETDLVAARDRAESTLSLIRSAVGSDDVVGAVEKLKAECYGFHLALDWVIADFNRFGGRVSGKALETAETLLASKSAIVRGE
jgi:DNA repair ATPase RecN